MDVRRSGNHDFACWPFRVSAASGDGAPQGIIPLECSVRTSKKAPGPKNDQIHRPGPYPPWCGLGFLRNTHGSMLRPEGATAFKKYCWSEGASWVKSSVSWRGRRQSPWALLGLSQGCACLFISCIVCQNAFQCLNAGLGIASHLVKICQSQVCG